MITRLSLAIATLFSFSAPALAGPGSCQGRGSDQASGQSVLVRLKVDAAGAISGREIDWEFRAPGPPQEDGLSVKLRYAAPVGETLGPVTSVSAYYIGMRSGVPLGDSRAMLETGTGKRWSAPLQSMFAVGIAQLSLKTPWGDKRNPELAETIETEAEAIVTLSGKKKTPFATLVLRPADHQVRDRLLNDAMAEARQRVSAPAPCQ